MHQWKQTWDKKWHTSLPLNLATSKVETKSAIHTSHWSWPQCIILACLSWRWTLFSSLITCLPLKLATLHNLGMIMLKTSTTLITNFICNAWGDNLSIWKPSYSVLNQLMHKAIYLLYCYIWHHNNMGNVSLASKVPFADKSFILWSLKYNSATQFV